MDDDNTRIARRFLNKVQPLNDEEDRKQLRTIIATAGSDAYRRGYRDGVMDTLRDEDLK